MIATGLTAREGAVFAEVVRRCIPEPMGSLLWTNRLTGRLTTRLRPQPVEDRVWYRSLCFGMGRETGIDYGVQSFLAIDVGAVYLLGVHRNIGERMFSERQRRLVRLFHDELGRHLGVSLFRDGEPSACRLSPRLCQTLRCLLEGDSEKQVARKLGVSFWTARQYVQGVYRHFGACSRGELMARFVTPAVLESLSHDPPGQLDPAGDRGPC